MDRFVTKGAFRTPRAPEAVLYEQPGIRLLQRDFREHAAVIDRVVADAKPKLTVKPPIFFMGEERRQQRNVGFFSDESSGYAYSGQKIDAKPLSDSMREILRVLSDEYGIAFNGLLVNRYADGAEYVSAHGDDEKGLDKGAGVVIVSWGAERLFRLRKKAPNETPKDPKLFETNTLPYHALQMEGDAFQTTLKHEIPIQKRVKAERVSITARRHLPDYEGILATIGPSAPRAGEKRPREREGEEA